MGSVSIKNLTRSAPGGSRFAFSSIAKAVLPGWDVSLVFVGPAKARALNARLRGKEYVPNVLSYPLGDKSGEVIMCPSEIRRQAPSYDMSEREFILYLFIHGLLHLKGWAHGARMEQCERKLLAEFGKSTARSLPHGTTHRNRH